MRTFFLHSDVFKIENRTNNLQITNRTVIAQKDHWYQSFRKFRQPLKGLVATLQTYDFLRT